MIFYVRSCLSKYDSRIEKYFDSIRQATINYVFIGWLRGNNMYQARDNEIIFMRKSEFGRGGRNFINLIFWNAYLFITLIKNTKKIRIIHVIDLDSAVTSYVCCKIFRKKIIFDIYDSYAAVRGIKGFAGALVNALERYVARHADLTILAGPDRHMQLGIHEVPSNFMVLENVPSAEIKPEPVEVLQKPWCLGYFGVLEAEHRGLEHLLTFAARRQDIELHIAGYGALEDLVKCSAEEFSNIHYHGALSYENGLNLMTKMHIIVGMYYLSIENHHYAAPNKYYEHLLLGRGLLTTANTAPGRRVEQYGTGWAIAEGEEALDHWLNTINPDDIAVAGALANTLWNKEYSDYYLKHFQGYYVEKIKTMLAECS